MPGYFHFSRQYENLIFRQVGGILAMMGMKVKPSALREIIEDIDEDGQKGVGV